MNTWIAGRGSREFNVVAFASRNYALRRSFIGDGIPDTDVLGKQNPFECEAAVVYAHKLRVGSPPHSGET
jgi:hypothetical protein